MEEFEEFEEFEAFDCTINFCEPKAFDDCYCHYMYLPCLFAALFYDAFTCPCRAYMHGLQGI